MGLFDVFSKGGKYFGKAIEPKCEYCEHGKRASDGNKVLCTKKGMVDAGYHCPKFLYSPLKRVPVKQLERVGWLEGDYEEKDFAAIQKKKEEEAKAAAAEEAKAAASAAKASAPVTPKPAATVPPVTPATPKPAATVPPVTPVTPKPAATVPPVTPVTSKPAATVPPVTPVTSKPAATVPPVTPVTPKPAATVPPVTPATPRPAAVPPVTPKPAAGGDLASLAAMAEAAGEYIPEPVPAEEAPQDNNGMNALSSM